MGAKTKRFLYIASVRIPSEKASGLAIIKQCEAFAQIGHVVTLLCLRENDQETDDPFSYYGVKPSYIFERQATGLWFKSLGLLGFVLRRMGQMFRVWMYVRKYQTSFDLIYARDQWMLLPALFFPLPVFWEAHTKHTDPITKFVGKRAKKVIVISEGLKTHYSQMLDRRDLSVEPSGVDLEQFKNLPSLTELRAWLDIPVTAKVVGYIGKYKTMGETKGVDEIVEAFSVLSKRKPESFLLLAGLEKDEIKVLDAKLEHLGITKDRFKLCQLDQKKFAWYVMACDTLLLYYPDTEHYRNYMSPTKLLVYLASGRVVISSDLQSIKETVKDTSRLRFVPPNNINKLLQELIEVSAIQRKNMVQDVTVDRFSWVNRAKKISSVI